MRKLTILSAIAALGVAANAAILIDQSPTTGDNAWGAIDYFAFYDDFTVGSPGWVVDKIITHEYYGDAPAFGDVYTVEIWSAPKDFGGSLLNSATSTNVTTGPVGPYGVNTAQVNFDIGKDSSGWFLAPGTYWISFSTGVKNGPGYYWYNSNVNAPNGSNAYVDGFGYTDQWAGQNFDMAFTMEGKVVPEPATLLAIGAGLAALAARRRK